MRSRDDAIDNDKNNTSAFTLALEKHSSLKRERERRKIERKEAKHIITVLFFRKLSIYKKVAIYDCVYIH